METKPRYDVLIVGAGPAGLSAALELAGAGRKVLVLEKNKNPWDKVCAEGLTGKIRTLNLFKETDFNRAFKRVTVTVGKDRAEMRADKPFLYTVDRVSLGKSLAAKCLDLGVEICFGEMFQSISKSLGLADFIIGADGANSLVRKQLGFPSPPRALAFFYRSAKEAACAEIVLDVKKFGPFYAWIFPNRGFTTIGAGALAGARIKLSEIKKAVKELAEARGLPLDDKYYSAPLYGAYHGCEFGRVYLAGEAAGLIQDLTGEGIYNALLSGRAVARRIIDPKSSFSEIDDIMKSKRRQNLPARIYDFSPWILGMLYRQIPGLLKKSRRFHRRVLKAFAY